MKINYALVGKESVGKSQFIRTMTGKNATSERIKGTTLRIEKYTGKEFNFIDTPGIVLENDSITTKMTLERLDTEHNVIVMVSGYSIDEDLADLLPIVQGKKGLILITHWDKVSHQISYDSILKVEEELGTSVFTINSRNINEEIKTQMSLSMNNPVLFNQAELKFKVGFTPKVGKSIVELPWIAPIISIVLLILPAWIAVQFANSLADHYYTTLMNFVEPLHTIVSQYPAPLNFLLAENYGLISMLPFLLLYALPTIFIFSVILSIYKSSGLIDRLSHNLHSYVIHFGLTGRDLVRIVMGFGCNVPSVISTRSSCSCTRGNCISAISFGAACSYQLPATIAVFSAAKMEYLIFPYLGILTVTTLIYMRVFSHSHKKQHFKKHLLSDRDFMQWPSLRSVWADIYQSVKDFVITALPIFTLICIMAGILDWLRIIKMLTIIMSPIMFIFHLPAEASTSIVLGSIRKDGIAIGLIDSSMEGLKGFEYTPIQVLTVVYLSGVLLPCIVTLWTIVKETNFIFAVRMVKRQILAASFFSFIIGWTGWIFA